MSTKLEFRWQCLERRASFGRGMHLTAIFLHQLSGRGTSLGIMWTPFLNLSVSKC